MTTEVSAFCQYSLLVVIVRVTLQEENARLAVITTSSKQNFFIAVVFLVRHTWRMDGLITNEIAVGIVIAVEFAHGISEKRSDFVLGHEL